MNESLFNVWNVDSLTEAERLINCFWVVFQYILNTCSCGKCYIGQTEINIYLHKLKGTSEHIMNIQSSQNTQLILITLKLCIENQITAKY